MSTPHVFNVRPVSDHSAIKAYFDVRLDCGLAVRDWMLFAGPNGPWINPQGIPQIDANGLHRIVDGKRQYTRNITCSEEFKAAVLAQLNEAIGEHHG